MNTECPRGQCGYQSVIKVENLTYIYSPGTPFEFAALEEVSLEVRAGEIYAVVGATGSGKSTLAQHFNGLLTPAAGKVRVLGLDTADKRARSCLWREVGLVFQQPEQQIFAETVFDEVAFGPRNMALDAKEVEDRVNEALALAGLPVAEVRDISPFALSGGLRRRLAIAGVLAMRPQVLILDEPTAGLDPAGRRAVFNTIEGLRRERGVTVVLVTHDMEEVAQLATSMAVLSRGRLLKEGKPREVFTCFPTLQEAGLELPAGAGMMRALSEAGRPVRTDVLTLEEAEEEIAGVIRGLN